MKALYKYASLARSIVEEYSEGHSDDIIIICRVSLILEVPCN